MSLEFNQKIQKIQEAINIVDVVGQYLKLNHKSNNFWAVCPFHEDSNPSLSVSQDKQIYKCFACGAHGNVFTFLQNYKNIDFYDALKEAATIAKINLKDFDLEVATNKKIALHPIKELNNLAVIFYQYQLTTEEGKKAIEYLKNRNIAETNINDFALGYAPHNNQLIEYLELQGYNQVDIIEAGLAKVNNEDKVKDMFLNRITFPIIDLEGNCLGFSARNYLGQAKDNFKYINTPETEVFKKGHILYNLYNAKKAVTVNTNNIYIVEGYMDVISLTNQNINNCVALMGTNLTKQQMMLLGKITNNIVIFLDGDEAGKNAAYKIAINLLTDNFNVKIVNNPTTLDPDELINKEKEKFQAIIKDTLHPLDFSINFFLQKYDIKKNSEELKQFLLQLKPLWNSISDAVTINFYLSKLREITNLTEEQLHLALGEMKVLEPEEYIFEEPMYIVKPKKKLKIKSLAEKLMEIEKELFFLLLLDRSTYLFLEQEKFIFANKNLMNLYFLISQKYQEDEKINRIDFDEILNQLKDNEIFNFLELIINQYKNKNYQVKKAILQDYMKIIKKYLIEIEINNLNQQIIKSDDDEIKIKLLKEMSVLKNKLNE